MINKSSHYENAIWDVIVIGGGPAGMMAAGTAAQRGAKVLLLEKNKTLGKKLLITGGGRCNVTNAELDTRKLLNKFKENNKFLFSAFSQWSVKETLDFFHTKKMPTKIEALQRVFPVSDKAQSVWNVLVQYLQEGHVTILPKVEVIGIKMNDGIVTGIKLKDKKELKARSYILATGGKSHPETGSTGEWMEWMKAIGHTIVEPSASLVPLRIKDSWVKRLQGITLQDIKLTLFQNGAKQSSRKGKILFTHFGVTGPTVLNMSKEAGELLKYGEVILSLDILPHFDHGMLNMKLQEVFKQNSNKKIKNSLRELMPSALVPVCIELANIDPEKYCHNVTREERIRLVDFLKNIPMKVQSLLGVDKAVITSGGIILPEVDFRTMRSRLFPNLYFVGDVLNIDRPTGGYGLQLCWTTGFVAGNSIEL